MYNFNQTGLAIAAFSGALAAVGDGGMAAQRLAPQADGRIRNGSKTDVLMRF
jgi:hypothetical protein